MDATIDPESSLAQPTRARLFGLLGELRRPASTDELAERLGLHPNGVRLHLERLHEAGLLDRGREQGGRGRPRVTWSVSTSALPAGERPSAYADLGGWLVRTIEETRRTDRDVEQVGREIGREIAPRDAHRTGDSRFAVALGAMGFWPRAMPAPAGEQRYCLDNCPYRDTVDGRTGVVCTLHRGITQGLLDVIEPESVLVAFRPEDPQQARCRVTVRDLSSDAENHESA